MAYRNFRFLQFDLKLEKKIIRQSPRIVMRFLFLGNDFYDTKMSFVMPKEHSLESLPEPNSDNVELLTVSPKKYAVITFPGYANNKKISKYEDIIFIYEGYLHQLYLIARKSSIDI